MYSMIQTELTTDYESSNVESTNIVDIVVTADIENKLNLQKMSKHPEAEEYIPVYFPSLLYKVNENILAIVYDSRCL